MVRTVDKLAFQIQFDSSDFVKGGQKAKVSLNDVRRAARSLETPLEKLERQQKQLNRAFAGASAEGQRKLIPVLDRLKRKIDETRKSSERLQRSGGKGGILSGIAGRFGLSGGALAGAGLGAAIAGAGIGLTSVVNKTVDFNVALGDMSDRLGTSLQGLQEIQFAASLTGVSSQQASIALQRMTRRISEAAIGSGEAQGALRELGLSAQRLNALRPDEQFLRVADAMRRVSNQSDRVRLAFKLFDSEGVALVNTLRLGSQGIRSLGAGISAVNEQDVDRGRRAQEIKARREEAFRAAAQAGERTFGPTLTAAAQLFTGGGPELSGFVSGFINQRGGSTARQRQPGIGAGAFAGVPRTRTLHEGVQTIPSEGDADILSGGVGGQPFGLGFASQLAARASLQSVAQQRAARAANITGLETRLSGARSRLSGLGTNAANIRAGVAASGTTLGAGTQAAGIAQAQAERARIGGTQMEATRALTEEIKLLTEELRKAKAASPDPNLTVLDDVLP